MDRVIVCPVCWSQRNYILKNAWRLVDSMDARAEELLYKGKNSKIYWNSKECWVHTDRDDFTHGDDLRQSFDKVLEILRDRGCSTILADFTDFMVGNGEDQQWVIDDWFPRAMDAGMRYLAVISPRFRVGKLTTDVVTGKFKHPDLKVAHFNTVEKAVEWLRTCRV